MPKVSVLMPSLNTAPYIRKCIDSVLSQTLTDIEIICIDGWSSDCTMDILKEYVYRDDRIKLLCSEKNSYGYKMNLGLGSASGEYIGIVETDDFIKSNMYESLYSLTQDGMIDLVKGNFWQYSSTGETEKTKLNPGFPVVEDRLVTTLEKSPEILSGHPSIWSAIYRRDFLCKKNIRFIEEPDSGWVDNPFYYETLCAAQNICITTEPYYYYRLDNPNSSSNHLVDLAMPFRRMMDNLDVLEKYQIKNKRVLANAYLMALNYIEQVRSNEDYSNQFKKIIPSIQRVLARMDREIVNEYMSLDRRELYYFFLSPLRRISPDSDDIRLNSKDTALIMEENNFLHQTLKSLIYSDMHLNNIENSMAYKIGCALTKIPKIVRNIVR